MAKEQLAKIEPQKAPYETPRIFALKVNLSFASSATDLDDIFGLAIPPQSPVPDKSRNATELLKPREHLRLNDSTLKTGTVGESAMFCKYCQNYIL